MSYITKIIETLGGWKKAWSLVKPSTSTTVMAIVLFVLVIFFPEHQWQSQEDNKQESNLPFVQTQQEETTKPSTSHSPTTQVEDSSDNKETDSETTQDVAPTSEVQVESPYEEVNPDYTPQPHHQESTQNTPGNMQGGESNTDVHNAPGNENITPSSQNQEPTPAEGGNTPPVQPQGEEGVGNSQ